MSHSLHSKVILFDKHFVKFLLIFLLVMLCICILQDLLHSIRTQGIFEFYESLLFKSCWLLFAPIILWVKPKLTNQIRKPSQMLTLTITLVLLHLLLLPLLVWLLSLSFFDHSYDYYKVFTFTLANDLLKIIFMYSLFVAWFNYFHPKLSSQEQLVNTRQANQLNIIISSGGNHTKINPQDIMLIKADTPYISIHLADKHYLQHTSLKSIAKQLDNNQFVRVHRSNIVNIEQVDFYQSRNNGDYDLHLKNGESLRLSRNYVKSFKQSLENKAY